MLFISPLPLFLVQGDHTATDFRTFRAVRFLLENCAKEEVLNRDQRTLLTKHRKITTDRRNLTKRRKSGRGVNA
jgi:hypothetical protein